MPLKAKTKKARHVRPLSQKPAAIKLREIRKNRSVSERLIDKINSQRRSSARRARAILSDTAWSLLGNFERETIWKAVEGRLRLRYDDAALKGDDTLSTSEEAHKAITTAFEENAQLFVQDNEDEPLPCELFHPHEKIL